MPADDGRSRLAGPGHDYRPSQGRGEPAKDETAYVVAVLFASAGPDRQRPGSGPAPEERVLACFRAAAVSVFGESPSRRGDLPAAPVAVFLRRRIDGHRSQD